MRRAAWISLACFCIALGLAALRAQADIRRESRGADQLAQLVGELAALQSVDEAGLAGQLERLRGISRGGKLRHLDFQLEDAAGQIIVAPAAVAGAGERTRLYLQRGDGRAFRATLIASPASETEEAFANIAGMAGLFLAYGLAMLVGLYWAVRRAFAPLRSIVGAIAACREGDFGTRLPRLPVSELDHIGGALNHLADALAAAQARQRQLSLQVLSLQEDERARLAGALQEQFAQALTALRANMAFLLRCTADQPQLNAAVRDADAQGAAIHQGIRSLLRQLQPGDAAGGRTLAVLPLLHELVKSWQDAPGQVATYRLDVQPADLNLPRELGLTLYRMTQEALANIDRHADARVVAVSVHVADDDPAQLAWTVSDDGVGIAAPESASGHGNGLAGIRERVWAHGGAIDIGPANAPGGRPGLCLSARLPLGDGGRQ